MRSIPEARGNPDLVNASKTCFEEGRREAIMREGRTVALLSEKLTGDGLEGVAPS